MKTVPYNYVKKNTLILLYQKYGTIMRVSEHKIPFRLSVTESKAFDKMTTVFLV